MTAAKSTHRPGEVRSAADPAMASEAAHSPRSSACNILVVEDERRLREMLVASMTEMGLRATGVQSAESALRLIAGCEFAIAVVDLNLPGMDGMELCETVRRRSPDMQIIVLTGYGNLDAAKRAIRLDVVDFLTKPCGMDELEIALERARSRWVGRRWNARSSPEAENSTHVSASSADVARPSNESAEVKAGSHAVANTPAQPAATSEPILSLEQMERQLILAALERHHGNREAAAAETGISLRKLYYRLKQYQKQGYLPYD